jgi:hypothetical protein
VTEYLHNGAYVTTVGLGRDCWDRRHG